MKYKTPSGIGHAIKVRSWMIGAGAIFIAVLVQSSVAQHAWSQNPAVTSDFSEGVLLLKSGRVVSGRIRQVSTGYVVSSQAGFLAISFEQVRFAAADLEEVYLTLRLELKDPSIKEQYALAEWCFAQKYYAGAIRELREILQRDPEHESARRLLQRIDEDRQRNSAPNASRAPERTSNAGDTLEARSLAGLSARAAQQFVSAVQPLLLNKCGSARCHGGESTSDFRLVRGAVGASHHRIYAERNLAAVLRFVAVERPSESPLLKAVLEPHMNRPVLSGASAGRQQKLLTEWIQAVAGELHVAPSAGESFPERSVATERPASASETDSTKQRFRSEQETPDRASNADSKDPPAGPRPTDVELSEVQKLLSTEAPDAFDPAEFNRRYAIGTNPR